MNLKRPYGSTIVGAALAAAAALTAGAALNSAALVAISAAGFAGLLVAASWSINQGFMRLATDRTTAETGPIAGLLNARAMAVVYAWGGSSMLTAYYLTPLFWHHAWQYGGAMLLVAAALHFYAAALAQPGSPARAPRTMIAAEWLTAVQGVAAIAGVLALIVSGKLTTGKPDWVANIIFISGGLCLGTVSAFAVTTTRRLRRRVG